MINPKGHTDIGTIELLKELDSYLMTPEGEPRFDFLAFDTETNGVEFFKNVIIGFSISPSKHQSFYIPLLEWVPVLSSKKTRKVNKESVEVFEEGFFQDVWRPGMTYAEDVTPDQYKPPEFIVAYAKRWLCHAHSRLLMHNSPFDCNFMLYNFGIDLAPNLQMDTILAKHFLNENTSNGLKSIATQWKRELGFNPEEDEIKEQRELGASVIRNGGTWNQKTKHVWRGDPHLTSIYAGKDTCLTFGVTEVALVKFDEELTEKQQELFFVDEIMPLCREVVIPMRFKGMYIDVPYFEELKIEVRTLLDAYEDKAQEAMNGFLEDFPLGPAIDKAVSKGRFHRRLIELEGLDMPTQTNKKTGKVKPSLAKKCLQDAFVRDGQHWLWAYMLGAGPMTYSDEKVAKIRQELYEEVLERRYRFNVKSSDHLGWLFCEKLGVDPRSLPGTDSSTPDNHIPSFDADILEEILLPKFPEIVRPILTYKRLEKLRSTYIEPALNLQRNSKIHVEMKQFGTVSGRFSCSGGYNLQTLPRALELNNCSKCDSKNVKVCKLGELIANFQCLDCKHEVKDIVWSSAIKKGFIAPPGFKIVNSDFSSLEPRCFSFVSGEQALKDIYKNNLDFYSKFYCLMFPEAGYSADPKDENFLKKKNPALRTMIKPVCLSIPYGSRDWQVASLMGLKKTITLRDGTEKEVVDVDKGRYYRELFLSALPELAKYMEDRVHDAVTKGYVETLFGRRRRFQYAPEIFQLITHYGLTIDEFLDARYKDLESANTKHGLRKDGLWKFAEVCHKPMWVIEENKNWAYLQGLFKNELNNSRNAPIQGLAAHITNRSMLEATRSFRTNIPSAYICNQIHDEICCYVPEDDVALGVALLREGMEKNKFALALDVAILAEPVVCTNLEDSK